MNNVTLVGRIIELEDTKFVIGVARPFKNMDGIRDTDYITCKMYKNINENGLERCEIGDIVGIKGHLQSNDKKEMFLFVEKISFLKKGKEK